MNKLDQEPRLAGASPPMMDWARSVVRAVNGLIDGLTAALLDIGTRAPLDSPAFTGTPTAPTQASSDNSTRIATTAWCKFGLVISLGATSYIKFPSWMGGPIIQFGTSVVTFTGALASTSFGMAFPNGKVCQLCMNGDGDALPGTIMAIHSSGGWGSNLSGIAFKAVNGATAASVPDGTVLRVNWISIGN